jgi:hypothetical protein
VPTGTGLGVLALYGLVYCLPCLLLLGAGLIWRGRITAALRRVYDRLGAERRQPRSLPAAFGLLLLGLVVAALAVTL